MMVLLWALLPLQLSLYPSAWAGPEEICERSFLTREQLRLAQLQDAAKIVSKIDKASRVETRGAGVPVRFQDSDLMIVFSSTDLPNIQREGFKNAHETRSSSYAEDDELREYLRYRKGLETTMAMTRSVKKEILPKYGIVQCYDQNLVRQFVEQGLDMAGDEGVRPYGDVAAVLKSDVKSRTTFTLFDSLALYGELDKPEMGQQLRKNLRTFTEGVQHVNFENADMDYRYIEAQIWGPLSLEDVSHFIISPGGTYSKLSPDVIQAIVENLRGAGKPIFLGRSMDTKLKQVFPFLSKVTEPLDQIGYLMPGKKLSE